MTKIGGPAWRQTIFYPFMHTSIYGQGTVLRMPVSCGKYDSASFTDVPYLENVAVSNEEKNELTLFAVNRSLDETMDIEADVYGFEAYTFAEHITMYHSDLKATNSAKGEIVKPQTQSGGRLDGTKLSVRLPPVSWNVIRLKKQKE
jgi:alpha-N-arabinofuranosidase